MVRMTMMRRRPLWPSAVCSAKRHDGAPAHPDIFYNYFQGPSGPGGGVPAQLYVSPRPTPPMVGHTWITYPPLNPHEFLYHHKTHVLQVLPRRRLGVVEGEVSRLASGSDFLAQLFALPLIVA